MTSRRETVSEAMTRARMPRYLSFPLAGFNCCPRRAITTGPGRTAVYSVGMKRS